MRDLSRTSAGAQLTMYRARACVVWLLLFSFASLGRYSMAAVEEGSGKHAWSTYTNVRFRFSICYPQDLFVPEGESANSDGQRFKGPDGSILVVYGSNNVMGDSLEDHLKQVAARLAGEEGKVTYTVKRKTWYVASGRNGETVFYVKTIYAAGQFKSFELTYKNSQTGIFSHVLAKMSPCFVSTAP